MGSDTTSLGGRPRSLEPKDQDEAESSTDVKESRSIDVKNVREDSVRNAVDAGEGKDQIVNKRKRRHTVNKGALRRAVRGSAHRCKRHSHKGFTAKRSGKRVAVTGNRIDLLMQEARHETWRLKQLHFSDE